MPPRGSKRAAAAGSSPSPNVPKKVAKAAQEANVAEDESAVEKAAFNAKYYEELQGALNTIMAAPALANIMTEKPLNICIPKDNQEEFQNGFQEPFDITKCGHALKTAGVYQAGANMFATALFKPVMAGVPYRKGRRELDENGSRRVRGGPLLLRRRHLRCDRGRRC